MLFSLRFGFRKLLQPSVHFAFPVSKIGPVLGSRNRTLHSNDCLEHSRIGTVFGPARRPRFRAQVFSAGEIFVTPATRKSVGVCLYGSTAVWMYSSTVVPLYGCTAVSLRECAALWLHGTTDSRMYGWIAVQLHDCTAA